jgi:hypothetical protein
VSDFEVFLGFVRGRDFGSADRRQLLKSLLISGQLGNDRLSYALLASLHPISICKSSFRDVISFWDRTVDFCASRFYEYSVEELLQVEKGSLRAILSSPSLAIESEDSLLGTLIGLGGSFRELVECVKVVFLSESSVVVLIEAIDFESLTSDIWRKVCCRLRGDRDEVHQSHRMPCPFTSTILSVFPSILNEFRLCAWELLYRGTTDGFAASSFHGKCDNCSNTITLIMTTGGCIFGGFTPVRWDSSSGSKWDPTGASFLFSLVNPRNTPAHRFPLKTGSNAIYCNSSYGPTFSGGHAIYISDNSNANTNSYNDLTSSYENDTKVSGEEVFAGQRNFTVKEIEVFSVNV